MGEGSAIEWTRHTFNPWWGCTNVSPGCDHCYAETFARRLGKDLWGKDTPRRFFGDAHWNEPLRWDRKAADAGERHRVFCASMADVFEPRDDLDEPRERLWSLIEATPNLDWLLLTKRPEQVGQLAPSRWADEVRVVNGAGELVAGGYGWPSNVWLGTTVEDEQRARIRIPRLVAVPGVRVRFLSCEPLLGEVDLWPWLERLQWVIAGGESGNGHRPIDDRWVRRIRDDCEAAGVPFLFKQWGGRTAKAGGRDLDGRTYDGYPQ